jgi:protein-tyrosine-phosphatase
MDSGTSKLNILFICSGNIMRSVISECLLRARSAELLGQSDGLLFAESCGLEAQPDAPPHDDALEALAFLGVQPCGTGAARADDEHLRRCDLAITMTRQQEYVLASRFPEHKQKYFSLVETNGAIGTLLLWRGTSLDARDWVEEAGRMTTSELGRGLVHAASALASAPRELLFPLAGAELSIYELLTRFSPCFHQVSGVHDPIGGAAEEKFKCARLIDSEVTQVLHGLLALACTT